MQITIWLLSASCVALYLAMGLVLRPLGMGALRLQLTYSGPQFENIYQRWTELQRRRYAFHFKLDYPFLVLYGLLGFLVAMERSAHGESVNSVFQTIGPALMPIAAIADASENSLHQRMLKTLATRHISNTLASLAGIMATLKWSVSALFLVLLIFA